MQKNNKEARNATGLYDSRALSISFSVILDSSILYVISYANFLELYNYLINVSSFKNISISPDPSLKDFNILSSRFNKSFLSYAFF